MKYILLGFLFLFFTACSKDEILIQFQEKKLVQYKINEVQTSYTKKMEELEEIQFKDDEKLFYVKRSIPYFSKNYNKYNSNSKNELNFQIVILHHYLRVFPSEVFTKIKYIVKKDKKALFNKTIKTITKVKDKDAPLAMGLIHNNKYFLNKLAVFLENKDEIKRKKDFKAKRLKEKKETNKKKETSL